MSNHVYFKDFRTVTSLLITAAILSANALSAGAEAQTVLTDCNTSLTSGSYTIDRNLDATGNCFVVKEG